MSRRRSLALDFSVYLVLRIFICTIEILPFRMACNVARFVAWLIYHVDRRHRLAAIENLQHAFPGRYSHKQREALVLEVYRHFCTLVIEIIHVPRMMNISNWKNYMSLPQGERIVGALLSDRPLLIVTAHFGNWELAGYALIFLASASAIAWATSE